MNKITIVTDTWTEQTNGVTTTLTRTVDCLRALGFDVTMIEPSQFRSIRCPTYPEIPVSWNIWRVGAMIEASAPQYLHIATEGSLGMGAKLWADRHRVRYTTSYHTRYPEYLVDYFGVGLRAGYTAMRWFHKRAHAVMVNTETMRQVLEQHGLRNLVVWGRGVDTDLFRPDGPVAPLLADLPRPILLNVGRVSVEKNLPAFYTMPFSGSKVQVGGGPMLDTYRKLYPDVHFVGPQSGAELASYYRGADVFVFPSKSDTYGLVMLESIASGVPVAAYPVAGPSDVLVDGFNGSLCENLVDATSAAISLRQNDLRGWAMGKSWQECTRAFLASLVAI